jgi:hypothetical protein
LGIIFPITNGWNGGGASSIYGGGTVANGNVGADNALGYGTGGGGYFNGASAGAGTGGNGAPGIVIITEYI